MLLTISGCLLKTKLKRGEIQTRCMAKIRQIRAGVTTPKITIKKPDSYKNTTVEQMKQVRKVLARKYFNASTRRQISSIVVYQLLVNSLVRLS